MSERDDEIDAEFEHHLAASADELTRRGMTPADARAEAERRFGPRKTHHQRCLAQQPETTMRKTVTVAAIVALLAATAAAIDGWRRALRSEAQLHQLRAENERLVAAAAFATNETAVPPMPSRERLVDAPPSPSAPASESADIAADANATGPHIDGVASRQAAVMGAVQRGGLFATTEGETLRTLIARAGGPLISDGYIQVEPRDAVRTGAARVTLDLRAFMAGEVDDIVLGERMFIYVDDGTVPGVIYVDGEVTRPGVYQLPRGAHMTVGRLIAAAGGADDNASIQVRVLRRETINSVDRQREFHLSTRESEAFALLPDDHVLIEARKSAAPE